MKFPEETRGKMKHLEDWIKEILGEIPDGRMKLPDDSKGKRNNLEVILGEILDGKMKSLED